MKVSYSVVVVAALLLLGCQVPPDIKQLQDQNKDLQAQLDRANESVLDLNAQEHLLRKDATELNRVIDVLGTEKSSRVQESSSLRGQVRKFVQNQIDVLKEFLVLGDLLDYVGGELVERSAQEDQPLLLVDMANPIPQNGTLTGMGAYFSKPGSVQVKVLRPIDKSLVVIWESKLLAAATGGINRLSFPVSVGVEKGDVIAYYFVDNVAVSFDTGTGDTRYLKNDVALGGIIRQSSLQGASKQRAYSMGVFGLLN